MGAPLAAGLSRSVAKPQNTGRQMQVTDDDDRLFSDGMRDAVERERLFLHVGHGPGQMNAALYRRRIDQAAFN